MKMIPMISAIAVMALCAQAREAVKIDLAGEWYCAGTNFSGKVKLPGTLAGTVRYPEDSTSVML